MLSATAYCGPMHDAYACLWCILLFAVGLCPVCAKARFRDTHTKFGIAPCWGLSQKLPRLIGSQRAKYTSFTAAWVGAQQALAWGLLVDVVEPEQLMNKARRLLPTLARVPHTCSAPALGKADKIRTIVFFTHSFIPHWGWFY